MSFCPKCGKQVSTGDAFCSYCGARVLTEQAELRLTNIVEVTEKPDAWASVSVFGLWAPIWGRYEIKSTDGKVVGCIRSRIPCPKCGGELKRPERTNDLRNCPSCGAHAQVNLRPITVSYVIEGIGGEARGAIRNTQSGIARALNDTESIFDARDQLLAKTRAARGAFALNGNLRMLRYVMLDPQGKVLFEYHGDENGYDYQLIAPSGTVIAHILKDHPVNVLPAKYYVYTLPEGLDSFLVPVFVVLIDLTNEKLAVLNESGSYSSVVGND